MLFYQTREGVTINTYNQRNADGLLGNAAHILLTTFRKKVLAASNLELPAIGMSLQEADDADDEGEDSAEGPYLTDIFHYDGRFVFVALSPQPTRRFEAIGGQVEIPLDETAFGLITCVNQMYPIIDSATHTALQTGTADLISEPEGTIIYCSNPTTIHRRGPLLGRGKRIVIRSEF